MPVERVQHLPQQLDPRIVRHRVTTLGPKEYRGRGSLFSRLLRRLRRRDTADDAYNRERDELSAQYTGTFVKNPDQEYGIKPPKIGGSSPGSSRIAFSPKGVTMLEVIYGYFRRLVDAGLSDRTSLLAANGGDRAFFVLCDSDILISNGAFEGMFQNPTGEFADLLPGACAHFRLNEHHRAAEAALAMFEGNYPVDFQERDRLWNSWLDDPDQVVFSRFAELLDAANDTWYAHQDELYRVLAQYAAARA